METLLVNFIKALIIGLGASIPLGPVGVLCIQKTISKGRWSGFSLGVGSSVTDIFYSGVALLSLSFVSEFLDRNRVWVILIGGIIILFVGLNIALKNPVKQLRQRNNHQSRPNHITDGLQGFAMTITNPGALVLMLGIFAFVGVTPESYNEPFLIMVMMGGVFIGSVCWWFVLSSAINRFRKHFQLRQLLVLNRVCGTLIAVCGLIAMVGGIAELIHML